MKQAFFTQSSPLPTEYVSGEGVTKRLVYRDCDTEVSILEIAPGAGINWHDHLSDSEIYLQPSTGNGELCQKGDGHNFVNYESVPVLLLSVKSKRELKVIKVDGNEYVQGL